MTSTPSSQTPLDDLSSASARLERYVVGCDLGQSFDPTAIAVVRRIDEDTRDPLRAVYQIGHLERLPLGTPYPGVVRHVLRLLGAPRLRGKSELVIDHTGVGRPIFDMFESGGVTPIGVTIVAGNSVTNEGGSIYHVPKLHLISRVQALLHDGRLKIHKGLADAATLVAELQDFRAEVSDAGYWRFGARSGKHDDLVLAVAIALWRAHGDSFPGSGIIEYYRRAAAGAPDRAPLDVEPELVTLRAPPGITTVYTLSGHSHTVDGNGLVHVTAADAEPLRAQGWEAASGGSVHDGRL